MEQEPATAAPAVYAELVVRITPEAQTESADMRVCRVDLAFTPPGAHASTESGGRATFDLAQLRGAQNVEEYGHLLSSALFLDPVIRENFTLALALAGEHQLRLRLNVDSDVSAMHEVRWETLRTPDDNPVATGDRILFSRYLRSPDWRRVSLFSERELRAVVMIANPADLAAYGPQGAPLEPLDVQGELERAERALKGLPIARLTDPGSATLEHLIESIRDGNNVVYLVCHGAFVAGHTRLYLESATGKTTTVTGEELAHELNQLRKLPSLIVLASCQSAGSGAGGALSAVGPLLARAGVPAVLAMQERVSMHTSSLFAETFFAELRRDGRLDRGAAAARSRVKNEPDYWVPVLFSRISDGCLWPPQVADSSGFAPWRSVMANIRRGTCTPVVGPGLIEFLLGPPREMARRWADTYHFPMSPHERQDLPQVAQFLAVNQADPLQPAEELATYLRLEILERYGNLPVPTPSADVDQQVMDLVSEVGRRQRAVNPQDAYRILARLPFPIYVTANPDNLLAEALVEAGRAPVVELCRWHDRMDWPDSIWEIEPLYRPTPERPLIFHTFGQMQNRESLVLTEDNFFDFLLRVNRGEWKIPEAITAAWSKNALLFLGFQTDEWSFRVLFRTIMAQPGRSLGDLKPHVAVQIDPEEGSSVDPRRAKEYLEQYFGVSHITTYWGPAEQFIRELWFLWNQTGQAVTLPPA